MQASYLFTPALKLDYLKNGKSFDAKTIIVDLEDSIHSSFKEEARHKLSTFDYSFLRERGIKIGVRINPIFTLNGIHDISIIEEMHKIRKSYMDMILIPKINHHKEVTLYRTIFEHFNNPPELISIIETIEAVNNVERIAEISDALILGQADLTAEMYSANESYIAFARAKVCIAAAKNSIEAIDTNSFELQDLEKLGAECIAAKREGFTGKAVIHPIQINCVNKTFQLTETDLRHYRALIDLYHSSNNGFEIIDNHVIAPPFINKATKMLRLFSNQTNKLNLEPL